MLIAFHIVPSLKGIKPYKIKDFALRNRIYPASHCECDNNDYAKSLSPGERFL